MTRIVPDNHQYIHFPIQCLSSSLILGRIRISLCVCQTHIRVVGNNKHGLFWQTIRMPSSRHQIIVALMSVIWSINTLAASIRLHGALAWEVDQAALATSATWLRLCDHTAAVALPRAPRQELVQPVTEQLEPIRSLRAKPGSLYLAIWPTLLSTFAVIPDEHAFNLWKKSPIFVDIRYFE